LFNVPRRAGNHPRILLVVAGLILILIAAVVGWATVRPPQAPRPEPLPVRPPITVVEDLPQLKGVMDRWATQNRFMGAVLVAKGDRVLFRQAYGMADREAGEPNRIDSRFRLASVSKQFTAAAILKLQDEGVLTVRDPICKWIQPCPASWEAIRLTHLLSHTSGIPDLMARPGWGQRRVTPATPAELTADSLRYSPSFVPGTRVRYDNAGYNLLGAVVEQASGLTLEAYLRRSFFDPLGMKDTGSDADDGGHGIVTGYANFPAGVTAQRQPNVSIVFAAGALYSTLDDMLVWQRALHHGHVLSTYSYRLMLRDHAPDSTPDERGHKRRDWGYGIFVNSLGDQVRPSFQDRQIYHTGSWSGFRNLVLFQPDQDVVVIVLSNNYHQRDQVFLIAEQAMAEALGRAFPTALAR
jgi:CubicO group peptidase (beta-lactamase class C family)